MCKRMKTSASLIITLSFLLWFSFAATKPALAEVARDFDGDALVPGREYIISSATWGAGEGVVTLARTGLPCAYSVVSQSPLFFKGAPVKFRVRGGTSTDKIYVGSTDLEIEFVNKPKCAESSKWVAAYKSGTSSSPLVIGGRENHPNSDLVSGVFHIEKLGLYFYKLVFCPETKANSCHDVGRESLGTFTHLVANTEYPFILGFIKAEKHEASRSMIRMKLE